MKKLFTLLIMVLFVCSVQAERPTGLIKKATVAPVIDGVLDEAWDDAIVYDIDKPYRTEVPTIGAAGETTWRALWDADGMYVFITVNDDAWYPSYLSLGNAWEADKPEVYFDVNFLLEDAGGAGPANNGHHQVSPTPVLALIDGTPTTDSPSGVIWAFKVADPAYTVEYFVPWTHLVDKDGVQFDKTATMGFDVTIIDRDPGDEGRRRMVWANVGAKDESWSNMDDVGYVTFEGAEAGTYVDVVTITGGNTITKNKGSLQLSATVLPEDATVKTLSWVIENTPEQTGMATIDATGRIKAIADGEITVLAKATDGGYAEASVVVTLTNQKPTRWDLNQFRNGLLNEVDGNTAIGWGGWIDNTGTRSVVDGVFVNEVTSVGMDGANIVAWRFQTAQEPVFRPAVNDVPYKLSFTAWADAARKMQAGFEDPSNDYARYGKTTDARSGDGNSEWIFDLTSEAQRFEVDVTFDRILPNTFQKFVFALSAEVGTVYIDSILLISDANAAKAFADDTYAMYTVNFGVKEVEGAANGTLTAKVDDVDIVGGADVQEQKSVVFTAMPADGYKVKQWTNRGIVIAGVTADTHTAKTTDELDIMVEFTVATSIDTNVLSNLRVFPNPFNNTINIRNTENVKRVSITNIVGQRVLDMEVNGETTIDTGSFNTGVYFMIFEGNNGQRLVQKMIKR